MLQPPRVKAENEKHTFRWKFFGINTSGFGSEHTNRAWTRRDRPRRRCWNATHPTWKARQGMSTSLEKHSRSWDVLTFGVCFRHLCLTKYPSFNPDRRSSRGLNCMYPIVLAYFRRGLKRLDEDVFHPCDVPLAGPPLAGRHERYAPPPTATLGATFGGC